MSKSMKIKVTKPFAFADERGYVEIGSRDGSGRMKRLYPTQAYDEGIHDVSDTCAEVAIEAGWAEKVDDLDFYKVRVPEYNEDYWCYGFKSKKPCINVWEGIHVDRACWNAGNVFNTREQAESYGAAYEKLKEIVGDWEPVSEALDDSVAVVFWDWDVKEFRVDVGYATIGVFAFPSVGTAQRAIDEVGDDLHWFWRRRLL